MTTDIVDPIKQIFEEIQGSDNDPGKKLFEDDKTGDIALKSDLIHKEQVLVTALDVENQNILNELDFDLFGYYLDSFRRHKLSLNRLSRQEFVQVNMKNTMDRDLARVSNVKNLVDSRS